MNLKNLSNYFLFTLIVFALSCKSKAHVQKIDKSHTEMNATSVVDSSIYYMIKPYREKMEGTMNEVISYNDHSLEKETPEGMLGNFVSDAVFIKAKQALGADSAKLNCVIFNNGGLRTSVGKGDVTVGKIFELMPFDNELVIVELDGQHMKMMIDFLAAKGGMPVSGIRMEIQKSKPLNVTINGKPFDETKNYYVLSSDYLANGGDKMDFFKDPISKKFMKLLIRDVLIEYCRELKSKGQIINTKLDGRISIAR